MKIAVDTVESMLRTAKELGATHVVDESSGDPVRAIRDPHERGRRVLVEDVRLNRAAEQAFECLGIGGICDHHWVIRSDRRSNRRPAFLSEKKIQGRSMGSNRF